MKKLFFCLAVLFVSNSCLGDKTGGDPRFVDITGLDKVEILRAFYRHAKPFGYGQLHYVPGELKYEEVKKILEEEKIILIM